MDIFKFTLDNIGIPYKKEPPYSLESGFNCLSWGKLLYELSGKNLKYDIDNLKLCTRQFTKVEFPQPLDVALFYSDLIGARHIGIMLNDKSMSHCSQFTNGVAISDITRSIWLGTFKGFYRLNENISN